MNGARGVIINITGGPDLTLSEVSEASEIIHAAAHEDANIIFGAVVDPAMEGKVKITVIATGFDRVRVETSPAAQSARTTPIDLVRLHRAGAGAGTTDRQPQSVRAGSAADSRPGGPWRPARDAGCRRPPPTTNRRRSTCRRSCGDTGRKARYDLRSLVVRPPGPWGESEPVLKCLAGLSGPSARPRTCGPQD